MVIRMKHIEYNTQGVCSRKIEFDLTDDNIVKNVVFHGGCNGNLKAIAKLVEGQKATDVMNILKGNTCGFRNTSCADQFSKAIEKAL